MNSEAIQTEQVSQQNSQNPHQDWHSNQLIKIQKFCFSKGIQVKGLEQSKCSILPPIVAIWYVKSNEKKQDYWVISGELPTDIAAAKVAKNARDVLRHFAMTWQLKAARMEEAIAEGKHLNDVETQKKVIQELIQKAEAISQLHSDDKLWETSGMTV
ncbi:DUF4826 family protein [Aliikangiella sp. IMCC44653]